MLWGHGSWLSSIMEVFKAGLGGALGNLVKWKVPLPLLRGDWKKLDLKVPSSPNNSAILC